MRKIAYKISAGIASAGLLISLLTPVVFAEALVIEGNGDNSTNTINNTNVCEVSVLQKNYIGTYVNAYAGAHTGGNQANSNTGNGDITIDTGNANASVQTTVFGGSNEASLPSCCQCNGQVGGILISGNGVDSLNIVGSTSINSTFAEQRTKTKVRVNASAKAKTGKNRANRNTGTGNREIKTGNADAHIDTQVSGGSNTLNP